jgi:hypothetical protein
MAYDEEYPEKYETVDEEILGGELHNNQGEVLARDRRILFQEDGLLKRRNTRLRFLASCGHLIHSSDEIGGRCEHKNCNALVCRDCLRICERCFKPVCPKHAKIHNGRVYCPTCKWIVFFFGNFINQGRNLEASLHELRNGTRPQYRSILFNPSLIEEWNDAVMRGSQPIYGMGKERKNYER